MLFLSYGEIGYSIIHQTVQSLFPAVKMDPSLFMPLTWISFLQRVLIPETALLLIMEDLKVKGEEGSQEALKVLQESSEYGAGMFPDNDEEEENCITVADKIVMKRALKKQKNIRVEEIPSQGTSARQTSTRGLRGTTMLLRPRRSQAQLQP